MLCFPALSVQGRLQSLSDRNVKNLDHGTIVERDKSFCLGKSSELIFPAKGGWTCLLLLLSLVFGGGQGGISSSGIAGAAQGWGSAIPAVSWDVALGWAGGTGGTQWHRRAFPSSPCPPAPRQALSWVCTQAKGNKFSFNICLQSAGLFCFS